MKIYAAFLVLIFAACQSDPEPKPTASFTYQKKGNGVVEFKSIISGEQAIDWNFGDGKGEARDKNPTHEFTKNGSYDVKLTAFGSHGNTEFVSTITIDDIQGSVVFWMQGMRNKEIEVLIAGKTAKITGFYSSGVAPDCGANYCATFDRLKPGAYGFEARELNSFNPTTWKGTVIVDNKGCVAHQLRY